MSIDTCHLNSKLNFILSSTVIKKKRCDSIIIWTIFSFYPAWFPNKNQMKPIPYERKKWSNPRETSGRFSYLLLTCVTGLLADSTSRRKVGRGRGGAAGSSLGRSSESNCSLRTRVSFLLEPRPWRREIRTRLVGKVIILVEKGEE